MQNHLGIVTAVREWVRVSALGALAVVAALFLSDLPAAAVVALPFLVALVWVSIRHPLVGLSCLIIMIVTNLSQNLISNFGLPSVAKLAAPGLFLLLAIRYAVYRERPYIGWLSGGLLGGFLILKLLGSTYAHYWTIGLDNTSDFLKDAIVAMLALAFMAHPRGFATVTATTVLTIATICALGAYQHAFGQVLHEFYGFVMTTDNNGRFTGPIEDPNFFAAIIVFCVPLAVFRLLNARSLPVLLFWGAVAGMLTYGLISTQSRGGILALPIGLAILCFAMNARQVAFAALLGLTGILAVAVFAADQVVGRLDTIVDVLSSAEAVDKSTEGRLASWQVAYELFKRNPWLGVGPGNFNTRYQDLALELGLIFRGEGRSTHSLYLEVLTEQGIVGLVFFLGMIGAAAAGTARAARRARRAGEERLARYFIAFGAGLAAYLTAMAFLQDSFPRFLWIVISLGIEAGRIVDLRLAGQGEGTGERPAQATAPGRGSGRLAPA